MTERSHHQRAAARGTPPRAARNASQRVESYPAHPTNSRASFAELFTRSLHRRRELIARGVTDAIRLFGGEADGIEGVYIDRYGSGCTLILYEGRAPSSLDPAATAAEILSISNEHAPALNLRAVYLKPFARDRSKLAGHAPPILTDPTPIAGETLGESYLIHEHGSRYEVRLFDGFSTGIFLDQRENRRFLANWVADRVSRTNSPPSAEGATSPAHSPSVLNTFAYTGAFSVACALAGARTATVDVSARYLEWSKRNFTHNGLDPGAHRFARMDTFEFFAYARRKGMTFDLIILDPPSFSSANRKLKIPAWSSTEGYARLIAGAATLLAPRGAIFASTNTRELCIPGRLQREIEKGLAAASISPARDRAVRASSSRAGMSSPGATSIRPNFIELPPQPEDFARERDRFAARMFSL